MAKREALGAWLHGLKVAELTTRRPGEVRCQYTAEAVARWELNTPLLSCSLPLVPKVHQSAGVFFAGLLPEGRHLEAMASKAGVPTYDTFGILARFGRDVAGAIVISAEDPGDRPGTVSNYTRAELAEEVGGLPDHPLGLYDDSELSVAGLQNKLLLVAVGAGWGRPVHGFASTHILKVEDRRYPGMAEMEAACLRVASEVGLTAVDVAVEDLGGLPSLIVSRFDRAAGAAGTVTRVHQEDTCQALGRDPAANRGRGKYEDGGGPSWLEVARLLEAFSRDPLKELDRLVRVCTYTVLIGNADAHGKNLAVLHPKPGHVTLASLYDAVPTVQWPKLRRNMAMSINGRFGIGLATVDDVVAEATTWHLDASAARGAAMETTDQVVDAVARVGAPPALAKAIRARALAFLTR